MTMEDETERVNQSFKRTQMLTEEFNDLRLELEALTKKKTTKERSRRKSQLQGLFQHPDCYCKLTCKTDVV